MLLNKSFYDAVASRSWCWFYFNARDLLNNYTNYLDWPPLPRIHNPAPQNSEFFGLHLQKVAPGVVANTETVENMNRLRRELDLSNTQIEYDIVHNFPSTWYCYGPRWSLPFAMSDPGFPAAGDVRPQYNYAGADAAIRIEGYADRKTPGTSGKKIVWTAAAKPFGSLNENDAPGLYELVLPAFHAVRLIPMDASSSTSGVLHCWL